MGIHQIKLTEENEKILEAVQTYPKKKGKISFLVNVAITNWNKESKPSSPQ